MAKEYEIKTIDDSGTHDQIIELRIDGLFITIFTYPNGRNEVRVHDCGAKEMKVESATDKEAMSVIFGH